MKKCQKKSKLLFILIKLSEVHELGKVKPENKCFIIGCTLFSSVYGFMYGSSKFLTMTFFKFTFYPEGLSDLLGFGISFEQIFAPHYFLTVFLCWF